MHHQRHGLDQVAQIANIADDLLADILNHPEIAAAAVLTTCNRVDFYLSTAGAAPTSTLEKILLEKFSFRPTIKFNKAAIKHIFQVAAGLDSMVIGEREISGQLKRAHIQAVKNNRTNYELALVLENALRTSRKIAHNTGLAGTGRSIVAQALNLVNADLEKSPHAVKALLVGTGSYAGAAVAQLRGRQIEDICVYSHSGRAEEFAARHELTPVPTGELAPAIAKADLVVSCRGLGTPLITVPLLQDAFALRAKSISQNDGEKSTSILTGEKIALGEDTAPSENLLILDLALENDVQAAARDLPQIRLVTLHDIQAHTPAATSANIARAEKIIEREVARTHMQLKERKIDPAIVALREHIQEVCTEEIARLPEKESFSRVEMERALQHFAARMAHIPSVLAHEAARSGEYEEYIKALHYLFGVDLSASQITGKTCPQKSPQQSPSKSAAAPSFPHQEIAEPAPSGSDSPDAPITPAQEKEDPNEF